MLFLVLVEQAILMTVAAFLYYRPKKTPWEIVKASGAAASRIARLAGLLVLVSLVIALPAVLTGGLLYKAVLSGHDINYYLSTLPPAFLAIAGVTGALLLSAAALLAILYIRTLLALPILLFERRSPVFQGLGNEIDETTYVQAS